MSNIDADNFRNRLGLQSITQDNVFNGTPKMWVNLDGDAATPSARGELNVSSITDNGTGDYTINFSNNMNDANYAVTTSCAGQLAIIKGAGPYSTSAVAVQTITTAGASVDINTVTAMLTGDLA